MSEKKLLLLFVHCLLFVMAQCGYEACEADNSNGKRLIFFNLFFLYLFIFIYYIDVQNLIVKIYLMMICFKNYVFNTNLLAVKTYISLKCVFNVHLNLSFSVVLYPLIDGRRRCSEGHRGLGPRVYLFITPACCTVRIRFW